MTQKFISYTERATQLEFKDTEKLKKYDLVITEWLSGYPLETKSDVDNTLYLVGKDFDKVLKYVLKKISKFP